MAEAEAVSAGHTYFGTVSSVQEAHAILEASKQGLLPRVTRRLTDDERVRFVRPGAVFVWEEKESGIRRWTDQVKWSPSRVSGAFLTYTEMPPNGDDTLIKQSFSSIDSQRTKMHLIAYTSRAAFASGSLPSAANDPLLQNLLRLRQQRDANRDPRWAASNAPSTSAKPDQPRPTTANSSASTTSSTTSNARSNASHAQTSATATPTGPGTTSARHSPPAAQHSGSHSRTGSLSHQHSFPSYPLGSHASATASSASYDHSQPPPRRALSVSDDDKKPNISNSAGYWSSGPASLRAFPNTYALGRPISSAASSSTGNPESPHSTRPSTIQSSTSAGLVSGSPAFGSMRGWSGLNELDLDDREPHSPAHAHPRSLSTPSAYASASSTYHPPPTGSYSSRPSSSHHHPYPRPTSAASQSTADSRRLPPILRPVGLPAMTGDSPPMPTSAHSTQGSRGSPLRTSFDENDVRRPRRSDEFGESAEAREWALKQREHEMGGGQRSPMPQIELPPLIPGGGVPGGWRDSEDERQLRLLGRSL